MRTVAPALPAAARRAATGVPSRNWTMYSSAPCAYTGPAAADINVMTNVVAPQRNADFEVFIPAPMNATPPPGRLDRRAQARMCPNPAVAAKPHRQNGLRAFLLLERSSRTRALSANLRRESRNLVSFDFLRLEVKRVSHLRRGAQK